MSNPIPARPRFRRSRRSFLSALGAAGVAGVGLSLPAARALAAEEPKLNFYNWDTYIGETTLADFKSASGIDVKMDLFGDNDELFAKLREGNPGYDVIVPTDNYVARMGKAGILQPLDHGEIPNRKNIGEEFLDAEFDPGRKFSMPYMWGTIGIGYRKSKVDRPVSWSSVWGPEAAKHKGKIAWLSESTSMLGMVMKSMGHSFNETDPARIKQAADMLIRHKENVLTIAEDNGQDLLAAGDCDLAVEWSGDIIALREEDDDVDYVVPREGSFIWQDCLCIPAGAPHPENAHAFINFILDAEVGRSIAEYIGYATPNNAAREIADPSYSADPAVFPDEETRKILEFSLSKDEAYYDVVEREWTRVLSA